MEQGVLLCVNALLLKPLFVCSLVKHKHIVLQGDTFTLFLTEQTGPLSLFFQAESAGGALALYVWVTKRTT